MEKKKKNAHPATNMTLNEGMTDENQTSKIWPQARAKCSEGKGKGAHLELAVGALFDDAVEELPSSDQLHDLQKTVTRNKRGGRRKGARSVSACRFKRGQ